MSSSSDGISLPNPGFYSNNTLPWGITNPIDTNLPASPTPDPGIEQEYSLLQTEDTAELLYASFLSPVAGIENSDLVLSQGAALLGSSSSATSSTPATSSSSTSSSTTQSTPSTDDANLPTYSDLISQSNATANAALNAYANAPAGSSIVDYQA